MGAERRNHIGSLARHALWNWVSTRWPKGSRATLTDADAVELARKELGLPELTRSHILRARRAFNITARRNYPSSRAAPGQSLKSLREQVSFLTGQVSRLTAVLHSLCQDLGAEDLTEGFPPQPQENTDDEPPQTEEG